jgi:hypothetical protein
MAKGRTELRLCDDEDVIRQDSRIERYYPRKDPRTGQVVRDWDREHALATEEIERRLRSRRVVTSGVFELGRLGTRSREQLRDCCACWSLSFMYRNAITDGDPEGFYRGESKHYADRADKLFATEEGALDYDESGDDIIDRSEEQRPFPRMLRRG